MRHVGFSTGAVALGDFDRALQAMARLRVGAVELSALRLSELPELVSALDRLDLTRFAYVSVHAPSAFSARDEPGVIERLIKVAERGYYVVAHPDAMYNLASWEVLEDRLCIENMDKRKTVGRTSEELRRYLDVLPSALLCFDIAHSRQVDSSMTEAYRLLREFGSRVRQVHLSEVSTASHHHRMSPSAAADFAQVLGLVPPDAAFIIEAQLLESDLEQELASVQRLLSSVARGAADVLT